MLSEYKKNKITNILRKYNTSKWSSFFIMGDYITLCLDLRLLNPPKITFYLETLCLQLYNSKVSSSDYWHSPTQIIYGKCGEVISSDFIEIPEDENKLIPRFTTLSSGYYASGWSSNSSFKVTASGKDIPYFDTYLKIFNEIQDLLSRTNSINFIHDIK